MEEGGRAGSCTIATAATHARAHLHEGLALEAAPEEGEEGIEHGERGGGHEGGGEPGVVGREACESIGWVIVA